MIKELYIDGYLVDIDDNFSIVRQNSSPFFSDVTQLKNNGSYSTKIPETQNNSFIMDYLEREDADTTFPYRGHVANYYVDSFPVFENAEVRVIDAFELQFVWGLNRGKYLPLFTRRLNEIVPNGTTILESDWVVPWKKANVIYSTGKKFKYLNYISGERVSDVFLDSTGQPVRKTMPPPPYNENLKEMTMHPFVAFTDILDLIIADHNANMDNIDITSTELDSLKNRLSNKGIILNGKKGNKIYELEESFSSDEDITLTPYQLMPINFFDGTFRVNSANNTLFLEDNMVWNFKSAINLSLNITLTNSATISLYKHGKGELESTGELVYSFPYTTSGTNRIYNTEYTLEADFGYNYTFRIYSTAGCQIQSGGTYTFTQEINNAVYSMKSSGTEIGNYDCLLNLPDITAADFINEMLKMTGLFIGHDTNGNIKFLSLDTLKTNLLSGSIYDWSGKVSGKEKSYFQFYSNAQKNWIKFANSDDRTYTAKDSIVVDDTTLDAEKDLYTISFDLPNSISALGIENILYKQSVQVSEKDGVEYITFRNEYEEKNDVCVYDASGKASYAYVIPNDIGEPPFVINGFMSEYYGVYKKIVYRPRVVDIVVKLDFLDTLNIDFETPVYISDYGKYAVLLDIKIPDDGLCNAKILLINQTL